MLTSVDSIHDDGVQRSVRASGEADMSTRNQLLYDISPHSLKPVRPRRRVMIRSVVIKISVAVVVPNPAESSHCYKQTKAL